MYHALAAKIFQHRTWFFLAFLLSTGACLLALPNFKLENNFKSFFSETFEPYNAYLSLSDEYPVTDSVILVLANENPERVVNLIDQLRQIENDLKQIIYFHQVKSILDIPILQPGQEDFTTEYPFTEKGQTDGERVHINQQDRDTLYQKTWERFQQDPRTRHIFVAAAGDAASISVSFNLPSTGRQKAAAKVNQQIQRLLEKFAASSTDMKLHAIGPLIVQDEINRGFKSDLMRLGLPILVLGFILIWWSNRSIWGLMVGGVSIVSALIITAAISTQLGFVFNQTSILAFVLVFIIGLADTIHLAATMFAHMHKGDQQLDALRSSIKHNLRPITLTTLTTAVGFACLYFCDSPPFQILGLTAAIGVLAAYFTTLCCLPFLFGWKSLQARGGNALLVSQFHRVNQWRNKFKVFILLGFGLLSVISIYGLTQNTLDNNELNYFPKDSLVQRNVAEITNHFPAYNRLELSIKPSDNKDITDVAFLNKIATFSDWLTSQPNIVHHQSYLHLLRYLNQAFHQGDPQFHRLPDNNPLSQDLLFLLEFSANEKFNSRGLISLNKDSLKLDLYIKALSNRELIKQANKVENELTRHFNAEQFNLSGRPLVFAHLGQYVIKNMLWGSLLALIGVTALTFIGLGSIKLGLISILPNLIPGLLIYGLWGLIVGETNIAAAVTFSLCLGIIVDDTIHILSSYQQNLAAGFSPEQAVDNAIIETGPALFVTTLVVGVGFSILALSQLSPNATIGYMSAPIIFSALILDFFLLPLLLKLLPSSKAQTLERPTTLPID